MATLDPTVLLDELSELRVLMLSDRRPHPAQNLSAFASSMVSVSDMDVMLGLIGSGSENDTWQALLAAYYEGGMLGFCDRIETRFSGPGRSDVFIATTVSVIESMVVEDRDASAYRLLRNAEPSVEVNDALSRISSGLSPSVMHEMRRRDDTAYDLLLWRLLNIADLTPANGARTIWQAKQYRRAEVTRALESLLDGRFRFITEHVLVCFHGIAPQFERILRHAESMTTSESRRMLNTIGAYAIQAKDPGALRFCFMIKGFSSVAIQRFVDWCKSQTELACG